MPVLYSPGAAWQPSELGVFPQVIVEVAFTPGPAAPAGTNLILDDATRGQLGHYTLASGDEWSDITAYVQSGSVTRMSTRQQGPLTIYQGGTASFVLNNSDGRFDPGNTAGPYAQVRPMLPVRVRAIFNAVEYHIFQGFATSWTPPAQNFGPAYDQTALACGDAFRILNGITIPATTPAAGAGEDTGARISRILAAAGWYTSALNKSVIATGDSALQATTFGDTALNLAQISVDSEAGELYIDGQGRVVFRNRHAALTDTRSSTVQAIFGGQPGTVHTPAGLAELPCTLLSRPDDDTTLASDVQATRVGGTLQEAQDATAVAKYLFPRTYARTDLILLADTDALNWANWVLHLAASDEFRFDEVTITPGTDPGDLFPQVLGRELGDRIQVWKRPPGVAGYSRDLFIRGIQHDFAPLWWQTKWTTQTASTATSGYSYLVLDDAALGKLNVNALAF